MPLEPREGQCKEGASPCRTLWVSKAGGIGGLQARPRFVGGGAGVVREAEERAARKEHRVCCPWAQGRLPHLMGLSLNSETHAGPPSDAVLRDV